jgi:thiamine-phosphate diphosphorylase
MTTTGVSLRERVAAAFGVGASALLSFADAGDDSVRGIAHAAARARGFVEREASILAQMCEAESLRVAPAAPLAGFAQRLANLPIAWEAPAFAPLADRHLGLYAIVGSADWVESVLAAGVRTVQLRVKDATRADLSAQVARSVAAARAVGAQFFVNDHWRLAIEHGAYGVHLGQEDLALADLAAIRAAGLRLGVSSHAYWEVCQARALAPSYIACGPIHATQLKRMPWTPQGEGNLAHWCALLDTPVVAIAGMDAARAHEAMRCGAAGVAVVSAITAAADPDAAVHTLQRAIAEGMRAPRRDAPLLARPTLLE